MSSKINSILTLLLFAVSLYAEEAVVPTYSLQDCRQMAIEASHNSELRKEALEAAKLNQQAALAAMFPKLSANAAYMWNSKSPVLLPNEMQFSFGTARVGANGMGNFEWSETSWVNQGKMNLICDNLFAGGSAVPCIVVMCNGMTTIRDGSSQRI